jgi:hypothetical protein
MGNRRVFLSGGGEVKAHRSYTVLTPNQNAAGTLDVTPLSLEDLAQQILGEELLAHPVSVQRFLRGAVEEALGSVDPDGAARTLLPSVRELFRSGADLDANLRSPRARRVVEVARAYRERLREQGLIDPAISSVSLGGSRTPDKIKDSTST